MSVVLRTIPVLAPANSVAKSGQSLFTVTLPSDVVAGETAVLTMHEVGGAVPVNPPGWTQIKWVSQGTSLQQYTWTKILAPTDSLATVDVSFPTGVRGVLTCVLARGTDGAPVSVTASASVTTASTTATGIGATPTVADSVVLEILSFRASVSGSVVTCGSNTGLTELYDYSTVSTTTFNASCAVYVIQAAAPSAIAAPTFTTVGTMSYVASAIVIAPSPVAVTQTVFKRKPGSIEFGLYTGPSSPNIRLKVVGMYDGKVVRPAHLYFFDGTNTAPVAVAGGAFLASGINGAGFQNDASQSPFTIPSGPDIGKRPIIVAADVAGVHRSIDGGRSYLAVNGAKTATGVDAAMDTSVADTLWSKSPTKAGTAYVLTDSGLYRSTNYGAQFQKRAIAVSAAANGKVAALEIDAREHPRHTSGLMAENADGTCLWIASPSGVKLSKDGGTTQFGAEAFAADHIRAMVWDPNSPSKLYVGIHNSGSGNVAMNGVWQIEDATTAMTLVSRVGTSWPFTRGCESLFLDDNAATTVLYAAAHNAGVASWTSGAWVVQNNGLDAGQNLAFQALHGVRTTSGLRLTTGGSGFGAGSAPARLGRYIFYGTVNASTGVVTWVCATAPAKTASLPNGVTVVNQDYGGTDPSFISQISYQNFGHGNDWVSSSLFFDIDNPNRIYSAGRGGLWIGELDVTTGAWTWTVSTKGLMVTVNMFVVTNPLVGGEAHIGSMDYTLLSTGDNALHASTSAIGTAGAPSTGDAGSYDGLPIAGQPVGLLVGASVRGAPTQSVANAAYFSDNPRGAVPNWQKLDFAGTNSSPAMPAGGTYDVVGVCLGRTAPGGTQVFMALVNQVGFFRKVGLTGTWTKIVDLPLQAGPRPIAYWAWRPNTSTVYCHVGAGVYRSDDSGANWVNIYTATATTYSRYNTIEVDTIDTTKLYVSNGPSGLVRLDNPTTSTSDAGTTVTSLTSTGVGSITVHRPTGRLFADVPSSGGLLQWLTPRSSTVSTDVSDQFKRDNGRSLRSIGITNDGWLITADNGQGAMRARLVTP